MNFNAIHFNAIQRVPGILAATMLIVSCSQPELGVMQFPKGKSQHVVRFASNAWKPCPSAIPKGCTGVILLDGSPKKADFFSVRFKVQEGFHMPAHTHPKDERVTILKGKIAVAFGKNATLAQAKQFGPGDYYVNARNKVHKVWALQESVLQITGIGPWQSHFIKH